MSNELVVEKYDVYSEKYNVHGEIRDFSFVIKLKFQYEDKEIYERGRNTYKKYHLLLSAFLLQF